MYCRKPTTLFMEGSSSSPQPGDASEDGCVPTAPALEPEHLGVGVPATAPPLGYEGEQEQKGAGGAVVAPPHPGDGDAEEGEQEQKGVSPLPSSRSSSHSVVLPTPTTPPEQFCFVFGVVGTHFQSVKQLQATLHSCIMSNALIVVLERCSAQAAAAILRLRVVVEGGFRVALWGSVLVLMRHADTKVWQCAGATMTRVSKELQLLSLRLLHADNVDATMTFLWPIVDHAAVAALAPMERRVDTTELTKHVVDAVQTCQRDATPCCVMSIEPALLTAAMQVLDKSVFTINQATFASILTGLRAPQNTQLFSLDPSPWKALALSLRH